MKPLQLLASPLLLLTTNLVIAHDSEPALPFERLHSHNDLEGHLHVGWESRYFSEGRDVLDGDSLLTTSLELGFEHFSFGYWYGISPEQDYDELQISAAYSNNIGSFDYYFSFTHFEFSRGIPGREFDNEVGAGISYSGLPYELGISLDIYYSFLEQGYFTTLTLDYTKELTDALALTASTTVGMNQDYISDGHDGLDHWAFRLDLEYELAANWALSTHLTYSLPLDRDSDAADDELLTNFFHTGLNLQWSF